MKIIRASVLGFCFGVRRAVELAENALLQKTGDVYSLGPLIHNENALVKLEKMGLKIIDENKIEEISEGSSVIIRAHGVSPQIINQLEAKKCKIIDATCPRVKASQKMVQKYSGEDDYVIMTGDLNHGEVKGIAGYAGKHFILIHNAEDAAKVDINFSCEKNIILMSQTTYSMSEFEKIQKVLAEKYTNITIYNTICPATKERQDALKDLCTQVGGVLVIGGKNSANTQRLFQIASENCKNAVHIQSADDIPQYFYSLDSVGITAGASTPDTIIDEVEKRLCGRK